MSRPSPSTEHPPRKASPKRGPRCQSRTRPKVKCRPTEPSCCALTCPVGDAQTYSLSFSDSWPCACRVLSVAGNHTDLGASAEPVSAWATSHSTNCGYPDCAPYGVCDVDNLRFGIRGLSGAHYVRSRRLRPCCVGVMALLGMMAMTASHSGSLVAPGTLTNGPLGVGAAEAPMARRNVETKPRVGLATRGEQG